MGLSVRFLFDPQLEGAQPASDIHLVATYTDELDEIAQKLGVKTLREFGIADDDESYDSEDEEGDPDEREEAGFELFAADEGVRTMSVLRKALQADPSQNPEEHSPEVVLDELEELAGCLQKAAAKGVRFRLLLV